MGVRDTPESTAAATMAIDNGLASTLPCPIMSAARVTRSLSAGTEPLYEGSPRSHEAPIPNWDAVLDSSLPVSLWAKPTIVVLQDAAKSSAKVGLGPVMPCS